MLLRLKQIKLIEPPMLLLPLRMLLKENKKLNKRLIPKKLNKKLNRAN